MLNLRSHGTNDYSVLEGGRRIGRIRFVIEGMPGVWLWAVTVPLSGGLHTGSAPDFNAAKAEFKAAWKATIRLTQTDMGRLEEGFSICEFGCDRCAAGARYS